MCIFVYACGCMEGWMVGYVHVCVWFVYDFVINCKYRTSHSTLNPLTTIWFCFNMHLPQTPARVYWGLVFNGLITFIFFVCLISGTGKQPSGRSSQLPECISMTCDLLKHILGELDDLQLHWVPDDISKCPALPQSSPHPLGRPFGSLVEECRHTFVQCFHAFYPTPQLKWVFLCSLLHSSDDVSCDLIELVWYTVKLLKSIDLTPQQQILQRHYLYYR